MRTIGFAMILGTALALSACQSARFGDASAGRGAPRGPVASVAEPVPAPAMPSAPVSSEPLPPPPGASAASPLEPQPLATGPIIADVPAMPGGPAPIEPLRPSVEPAPQQRVAVAAPGRSSVVGGWTAREASGSCRVQLSSAPALDLYKASAAGCGNRDLARVTAWDFREGEVFLYQPGGAVAARLRPAGGALDGVLAKSGAPLTLAR